MQKYVYGDLRLFLLLFLSVDSIVGGSLTHTNYMINVTNEYNNYRIKKKY